jgi:hypothetical protein
MLGLVLPGSVATATALAFGLAWAMSPAAEATVTVPLRPAARGWPGFVMTRFCWPATYVPAAAVMPKSSQRPASQTTTGTAIVRNFEPTIVEVTDELMTTTCLPVASAAVEAASSATVTA